MSSAEDLLSRQKLGLRYMSTFHNKVIDDEFNIEN